jgi:hypothetical protein
MRSWALSVIIAGLDSPYRGRAGIRWAPIEGYAWRGRICAGGGAGGCVSVACEDAATWGHNKKSLE